MTSIHLSLYWMKFLNMNIPKDYTLEKYEQEYNELNAEYIKQIIKFKRNKNG